MSTQGNDSDDEKEDVAKDTQVPMNWHMLPRSVLTDIAKSFKAKHIIDCAPWMNHAVVELTKMGISYFALCATELQQEQIKQNNQ